MLVLYGKFMNSSSNYLHIYQSFFLFLFHMNHHHHRTAYIHWLLLHIFIALINIVELNCNATTESFQANMYALCNFNLSLYFFYAWNCWLNQKYFSFQLANQNQQFFNFCSAKQNTEWTKCEYSSVLFISRKKRMIWIFKQWT